MTDPIRERLMTASRGLLFVTESEAPFEFVHSLRTADGPLNAREVMTAFEEEDLAREGSLEEFFIGHIEHADPADAVAQQYVPRFRGLVAVLRSTLESPHAYCFGQVERRCYVVGLVGDRIAGIRTIAYES